MGSYLDDRFVGLTRAELDVTDFECVRDAFQTVQPSGVLHLAAATNVDNCETESERTFQTNALGSLNVARACAEIDVPLIYISSAQVFAGDKDSAYHEFDMPNPRTVYGASKLAGRKRRSPSTFAQHRRTGRLDDRRWSCGGESSLRRCLNEACKTA